MEISAPLGYQSITPLLREMRVRPMAGHIPAFASQRNAMPIVAGEAGPAGRDYPIVFVTSNSTEFAPVAVVGLLPGENLFAQPEGWASGCYIPAYVRRYPFCMARAAVAGTAGSESIICIDTPAISADGVANFDTTGQPTPEFAQMQEFLARFEDELRRTRELCQIFADYKLFELMTAKVRIGELSVDLNGLYRIAEPRLQQLMSNQLKTLVRKGGMALIYQHLNSLAQLQNLSSRKLAAMARAANDSPALSEDADN